MLAAGVTGAVGALAFLEKLRISPDAAFSVGDWTVDVIFIVVIGGIGSIEGRSSAPWCSSPCALCWSITVPGT